MAGSYATAGDLEARWRPLTDLERSRAETLLGDASRRVRRQFPTTDARIAVGNLDELEVVAVVAGMVKRVMLTGDVEGVRQQSEAVGPFSASQTYANPMGVMFFTEDDLAVLSVVPSRRAFAVDLTPPLL